MKIDSVLQLLDDHLAKLRPEYYAQLNLPLSDAEIDSLEKLYDLKLPADLRSLYKWKNGQNDKCFESFINNSTFIPLEQALPTAQENTSMIGLDFEIENWWHSQWLPVFHNGGGDYICYDAGGLFTNMPGQIIEFWHADSDRNVIAPNLETLISGLNDYYDKTPVQKFDSYFAVEAIEGFPKKFTVE